MLLLSARTCVKVGSGSMLVSLDSEMFVHNSSNLYPIRISRLRAYRCVLEQTFHGEITGKNQVRWTPLMTFEL